MPRGGAIILGNLVGATWVSDLPLQKLSHLPPSVTVGHLSPKNGQSGHSLNVASGSSFACIASVISVFPGRNGGHRSPGEVSPGPFRLC
jgi:hypothetical protein